MLFPDLLTRGRRGGWYEATVAQALPQNYFRLLWKDGDTVSVSITHILSTFPPLFIVRDTDRGDLQQSRICL